jgi:hypothetical protein
MYSIQHQLRKETVLPQMIVTHNSEMYTINQVDLPVNQNSGFVIPDWYWTNDEDDSLSKVGWSSDRPPECNEKINKDQNPENLYTYSCSRYKKCYLISREIAFSNLSQMLFELNTPRYTKQPYIFIYYIVLFDRRMNLFNMYISCPLAEQVELNIRTWAVERGVTLIRNSIGPSQLIMMSHSTSVSNVKIQMCVRPECLYWTVETIILKLKLLQMAGMDNFKFLFLPGEDSIFSIAEVYPDLRPGEDVSTYVDDGIEYKREQLNMPNIILYIRSEITDIKPLVDALVELFPNDYTISTGDIPRFNMRINNNVCFSVGGGNEHKYALRGSIPAEYAVLLKNPDLCQPYDRFSKYLTGHDIFNEDCSQNNIKSYNNIFAKEYRSFQNVFNSVGLLSYYNDIFTKLRIPPILDQLDGVEASAVREPVRPIREPAKSNRQDFMASAFREPDARPTRQDFMASAVREPARPIREPAKSNRQDFMASAVREPSRPIREPDARPTRQDFMASAFREPARPIREPAKSNRQDFMASAVREPARPIREPAKSNRQDFMASAFLEPDARPIREPDALPNRQEITIAKAKAIRRKIEASADQPLTQGVEPRLIRPKIPQLFFDDISGTYKLKAGRRTRKAVLSKRKKSIKYKV